MERIANPKLDVGDLVLVLALAESGSTVTAATRLHVTQSAVSRRLLQAEDKLDVKLFRRTPTGLVATEAGQRLIAGAGAALAQLATLENQIRCVDDKPLRLRIVCECYTAYRWLPTALASLQRDAPRLELSIVFEHSSTPIRALLDDHVDVALVTTARVTNRLQELPLFADEVVFVVAASHPLAAASTITVDDLCEYPLISSANTPDAETRWFASRVFGRAKPRGPRLLFPLTEAIVDATRAGMGIAIMSEWIAKPYLTAGDLVTKRLRGRPLRRPWRMVFRREVAEGARQLAAVLATAAPRLYASP